MSNDRTGSTTVSRRSFLKASATMSAFPFWAIAVAADELSRKENTTTDTSRSILLSKTGGDRATAYAMSNKIARHDGRLLCTWICKQTRPRTTCTGRCDGLMSIEDFGKYKICSCLLSDWPLQSTDELTMMLACEIEMVVNRQFRFTAFAYISKSTLPLADAAHYHEMGKELHQG